MAEGGVDPVTVVFVTVESPLHADGRINSNAPAVIARMSALRVCLALLRDAVTPGKGKDTT
jgi:hypothetical protein